MVNGDVKDASEFGALGSLRKALVEREANAWWHLQPWTWLAAASSYHSNTHNAVVISYNLQKSEWPPPLSLFFRFFTIARAVSQIR